MFDIDWPQIKTEYITTNISQKQLISKYGVGRGALENRCRAEQWVAERKTYREQVAQRALQLSEDHEVQRLTQLMDTTKQAIAVTAKAFSDPDQFNRYIVKSTERYAEPEERIYDKVDTKALKDMTGVLKDLTGMMRDLYDLPTLAQRESQRIAEARLALQRQKLEAEELVEPDMLEVVFSAGEEEWND